MITLKRCRFPLQSGDHSQYLPSCTSSPLLPSPPPPPPPISFQLVVVSVVSLHGPLPLFSLPSLFSLSSQSVIYLSLSFKPLFPVHFHSTSSFSSSFRLHPIFRFPFALLFPFPFFSSTNEVSILLSSFPLIHQSVIHSYLSLLLSSEGGGGKEWNDSLTLFFYLSLTISIPFPSKELFLFSLLETQFQILSIHSFLHSHSSPVFSSFLSLVFRISS